MPLHSLVQGNLGRGWSLITKIKLQEISSTLIKSQESRRHGDCRGSFSSEKINYRSSLWILRSLFSRKARSLFVLFLISRKFNLSVEISSSSLGSLWTIEAFGEVKNLAAALHCAFLPPESRVFECEWRKSTLSGAVTNRITENENRDLLTVTSRSDEAKPLVMRLLQSAYCTRKHDGSLWSCSRSPTCWFLGHCERQAVRTDIENISGKAMRTRTLVFRKKFVELERDVDVWRDAAGEITQNASRWENKRPTRRVSP